MTTVAQRDQLALAAKAAGYTGRVEYSATTGECFLAFDIDTMKRTGRSVWAPLHDDGDAFRLASQLGMKIDFNGSVGHRRLKSEIAWTCTGPDAATTRQCIVQIAAELAQLPPEPKPKPIKMSDLAALDASLPEVLFKSPPPGQMCNRMMDRAQWMAEGAAVEREACASICMARISRRDPYNDQSAWIKDIEAEAIADDIRARGSA